MYQGLIEKVAFERTSKKIGDDDMDMVSEAKPDIKEYFFFLKKHKDQVFSVAII